MISFNSNGGSPVTSIPVEYDSLIAKPEDPVKDGYTFAGWFADESLYSIWNFGVDNTYLKDYTLYAKWEEVKIVYPYEVSAIGHYRSGYNVMIFWTNPTDANFSHVRIIPEGFEWAEEMANSGELDKSPGTDTYTFMDYAGIEYVIIKAVDKDGNVSNGVKYYLTD
jgi:uncharacterized repeat protein (TIGR02543 family)